MNTNMVLDFAQNLGQTRPLTQLKGQIEQSIGKKRYEDAFKEYRENPSQENLAKLYQVGIPLGYGSDITNMENVRQQAIQARRMGGTGGGNLRRPREIDPEQVARVRALGEKYAQTLARPDAMKYIQAADDIGMGEEARNRANLLGFGGASAEEGGAGTPPPDYLEEAYNNYVAVSNDPNATSEEKAQAEGHFTAMSVAAENDGYEGGAAGAKSIIDAYGVPEGEATPPPLSDVPPGYAEARQSDLFSLDNRNTLLEEAREADRQESYITGGQSTGYFDTAKEIISQYEKAEKNNPEDVERLQELLTKFGETGDENIASQADVLAQSLGLDVSGAINRHRNQIEARQQQQREREFQTEVDNAVETLNNEGTLPDTLTPRLLLLGQQAGLGDTPEAITNSFKGIVLERREQRDREIVAQASQDISDNPFDRDAHDRLRQSSIRLGNDMFIRAQENAQQMIDDGKREQLTARVHQTMDVATLLDSGNTDMALEELDEMIAASENPRSLQQAKQLITDGKVRDTIKQLTTAVAATGEDIGGQALDNFNEIKRREANEVVTDMRLAELMAQNDFTSERFREMAGGMAEDLKRPGAQAMIEAMSIVDEVGGPGSMTTPEVINLARSVANDLDKDVKTHRSAVGNADTILSLQGMSPDEIQSQGMVDQAFVTAYALLLDPNSAVREGEANRMLQAQGVLQRLSALPGTIKEGQILSEDAKDTIIQAASLLKDYHSGRVDVYEDRTEKFVNFMDPDGSIGVSDMVFLNEDEEGAESGFVIPTPTPTDTPTEDEDEMVLE